MSGNVTQAKISAAATATGAAFNWNGGIASWAYAATSWSGTASVQQLGPDGTTWLNVATAATANGITAPIYTPPGQYRFSQSATGPINQSLVIVPT